MVLEESGINRIVLYNYEKELTTNKLLSIYARLYNIDPEIAFNFAIIVNQMDHLDALGICSIYEELKNKGFKSLNIQDVNEIKTYYNIYKRCYKTNISKEESNKIKEEFIREVQKVDPLFGTKEEKRMNNLMN